MNIAAFLRYNIYTVIVVVVVASAGDGSSPRSSFQDVRVGYEVTTSIVVVVVVVVTVGSLWVLEVHFESVDATTAIVVVVAGVGVCSSEVLMSALGGMLTLPSVVVVCT